MGAICSDLVVVELGAGSVAASEAGMFLADNGARVFKVEPPDGDRLRISLPSGWLVWNRGKESVVADLRTAEGLNRVNALIAGADVVIEAFQSGQAEAWGLDQESLRASNPSLIYCSIKGWSRTGAYAPIKAYDAVVMAKAGVFGKGMFGFRDGPIFSGALAPSNGAAHLATSGILAALVVRDRTGVGQLVDASLYQGLNPNDYFVTYQVQLAQRAAAAPPVAPDPTAEAKRVPAATRYMVTSCTRDGRWIVFSPQMPNHARALMQVLELDELLEDDRFKDMPVFWTLEDVEEWELAIHERVKERDLAEWVERGRANDDLPFEPILSPEEALDHPQVRANGNVVTVQDPQTGAIEEIGPVGAFSSTPSVIETSAPALDEHAALPGPRPPAAIADAPLPANALEGVTIVEFGYYYAMPYGVTMAAALGARVIKIENLDGDPMRWSFGAAEWGATKTTEGKESICLNLRTETGRAIMQGLLQKADVFVQGFRPGADARLGVDYATVKSLNPDIVYVHGAGYGPSGPLAHRPIFAGTAMGVGGSWYRQAAYWLDPEFCSTLGAMEAQVVVAPRLRNLTDGDAAAALAVLTSIMFGLRHQRRTGEGQFVGTSMVGGNVLAYSDDFNRYEGKVPLRQADPEQLGLGALYRLYKTAEGWVFFAAPNQTDWEAAMHAVARPDLLEDPRFASAAQRDANDDELATELEAVFATRPAAEWEALLVPAGVACVVASERSQAEMNLTDPNLAAMGLLAEIDHPKFGHLVRYAAPVALSATPGRVAPGCVMGQHTAAILIELGYDEDEVAKLAADNVVRLAD